MKEWINSRIKELQEQLEGPECSNPIRVEAKMDAYKEVLWELEHPALSMSGVSDSVPPVIYVEQGNSSLGKDLEGREYYIKHVSGTDR